jgi:hypothetical protein
MLNKICTWTAKTRAIPSLHRDSFLAKVPGHVAGRLRRVSFTYFIAGPSAKMNSVVFNWPHTVP